MDSPKLEKITTIRWRQFLDTDAGRNGMLFLRASTPKVTRGLPHEIQFDAGFSMGYLAALDRIDYLIAGEQEKNTNLENA